MNLKIEKERVSLKYKQGTLRYYLHLYARMIKQIYHRERFAPKIYGNNNYVSHVPAKCKIQIFGDNNIVEIDPSVSIYVADIMVGDQYTPVQGCSIKIGKNCSCNGVNIRVGENNSSVHIGEDCMFSSGIEIWASDTHTVVDQKNQKIINWGKGVFIGNHVWVGMHAIILKNSYIGDNSIVGAGGIVTGVFKESHVILAGNPARVVKKEISWDRLRPLQYKEKFRIKES